MDQGKTVRLPLEIPAAALTIGHVEILDGTPVVSIISGPDRDLALAVKRLQDLVGAALLLVAPVRRSSSSCPSLIWRSDGGSPIFRQVRGRAERATVPDRQVPDDDRSAPTRSVPSSAPTTRSKATPRSR